MPEIKFAVAGEVFSLSFKRKRSFAYFARRHRSFVTNRKADFFIRFHDRPVTEELFSISMTQQGNKKTIRLNNQAQLRRSFKTRHLDIAVEKDIGVENYLRIFISQYLFTKGSFLLHASTIGYKNRAHVFTGPSGVGKSTIARISRGKRVLTDDLVAIKKTGNRYQAFATPFGTQSRGTGDTHLPIAAIYLISHAEKTLCRRIPRVSAFTKIISNIVLMGAETRDLPIDKLFDTCYNLVKRIPCYELPFNKNENIWRVLKDAD